MLKDLADIATLLGFPIGGCALFYTAYQIHSTLLVARGQFILELKNMLAVHKAVHERLRPKEMWHGVNGQLPSTAQEWCDLEEYMGFFEHCEILIQDGSLRLDHFQDMFAYRVRNIVSNPGIVKAKLESEREAWVLFLKLCDRIGVEVKSSNEMTQSRSHSEGSR